MNRLIEKIEIFSGERDMQTGEKIVETRFTVEQTQNGCFVSKLWHIEEGEETLSYEQHFIKEHDALIYTYRDVIELISNADSNGGQVEERMKKLMKGFFCGGF